MYLLRAGADAYERGLHGQALIKPTQDQSHYISRLNSPMDVLSSLRQALTLPRTTLGKTALQKIARF